VLILDSTVLNSISIINLSTLSMVNITISKCTPFISPKLKRTASSQQLLESCSLLTAHLNNSVICNLGKLRSLTISLIHLIGLTRIQLQLKLPRRLLTDNFTWWLILITDTPTEDLSQLHHVLKMSIGTFSKQFIQSSKNILINLRTNLDIEDPMICVIMDLIMCLVDAELIA